jgi:hypothetical protein
VIVSTPLESVSLSEPRFISDLHLAQDQPRTLERFMRLAGQLSGGELLILGDLFEYWAGDEEVAEGIGRRTRHAGLPDAGQPRRAAGRRVRFRRGRIDAGRPVPHEAGGRAGPAVAW